MRKRHKHLIDHASFPSIILGHLSDREYLNYALFNMKMIEVFFPQVLFFFLSFFAIVLVLITLGWTLQAFRALFFGELLMR